MRITRCHLPSASPVSSFSYPLCVQDQRGETGLGQVKVHAICSPAASRGSRLGLAEESHEAAEGVLDWPPDCRGGFGGFILPLREGTMRPDEMMVVIIRLLRCMAHT